MYDVGQIIYIYKESNDTLFPCIVCEEVVKKTLQGKDVSYKVLLPDTEGTIIDLSKLSVEVFGDLDRFKTEYIVRAKAKVSKSIESCEKICLEKFDKFKNYKNKKEKTDDVVKNKNSEKIVIEDENNVKLNFDMSKLEELGL